MKIHLRLQFALAACLACAASLRATEMVDVLILYTSEVAAVYTDHDGVEAHALATIANANTGFANSGLDVQLRLAHLTPTDYIESAVKLDVDLAYLTNSNDDTMDEVHVLRDEWGADLVCLFRSGVADNAAGLAWILREETGDDRTAFSVVEAQSALSNLTFAHEIGHNFGGAHARGDEGNSGGPNEGGLFEHSNGYRFIGGHGITYRTIMAYAPGSRINQFSTPDLVHQSAPTGKAAGDPESADNVATFEVTGPYLAQYRDHMPELPAYAGVSANIALASGGATVLHAEAVGAPELVRQWYEGVTGDESNPLPGETASRLETGPLTETAYFWQKATNPNGSANSPTIAVSVTPQPAEANAIDQAQSLVGTGYVVPWDRSAEGIVFEPHWQEFVPAASYTDSIEVNLWKGSGSDPAGGIVFQLFDKNGYAIYEHTVLPSELTQSPKWIVLPIRMYLIPGDAYQLQAHAADPLDSNAAVLVWSSHSGFSNPYPAGQSSLDSSVVYPYHTEPGYQGIDFSFRTNGSAAERPLTEINPVSSSVGAVSGSYAITVTSNTAWSVAESLDWLTTSPASGSGNATVTINYATNPGATARSGTFSIGGIDHLITQSGGSEFTAIDLASNSVTAAAGSYPISVTSNTSWTVAEDLGWLSASPASGSGDATVTLTYLANPTTLERGGAIMIGGNAHQITQAGSTLSVALDPSSRSVASGGGSYELSVVSNGDWTLSESAAWLSVAPVSGSGDGTATVTVEANATPLHRSAVVAAAEGSHTVVQFGLVSAEMGFADWLAAYFSGEEIAAMTAGPELADSDGDGASNGLEFRFGLNPAAESIAISFTVTAESGNLNFEFGPTDPDFQYTVRRSVDLLNWEEADIELTLENGVARFTATAEASVFYRVYGEPMP